MCPYSKSIDDHDFGCPPACCYSVWIGYGFIAYHICLDLDLCFSSSFFSETTTADLKFVVGLRSGSLRALRKGAIGSGHSLE